MIETETQAECPMVMGHSTIDAPVLIGDREVWVGHIVDAAHTASEVSADEWNGFDGHERDSWIEAIIAKARCEAKRGGERTPLVDYIFQDSPPADPED